MNKQDTKIMEYFVTACNFLDGYGLTVTDDDLLRETMTKNFGQFQTIKGLCQEQTLKERDDLLAACKDLVGLLEQIFQALVTSASNEVADTIIKYGTANHSNTVEEARSLIASVEAT